MNAKRLLLIVNPISGTGSKTKLIPKLEHKLQEKGYNVTTHLTTGAGDATKAALKAIEEQYDVVAVCGGDGTVNETACALSGTSMPMAILPAGSGNGLARHLGLVPDALSAVKVIDDDNIITCDHGTVNGRKFFCAFGVGFDAAVAHKFAACAHRGLATYVKSAVTEFAHYHPKDYTITVDGTTTFDRKAYLVACCNASQYGNNAFIAPEASLCDGVFDLVIMHDASHLHTLLAGLDMFTGMLPHNRQIEIIKAKSVKIECHEPDVAAHIDGEPINVPTLVDIEMHPSSIRLYAKRKNAKFTPFITPIDYMSRDITAAVSKIIH